MESLNALIPPPRVGYLNSTPSQTCIILDYSLAAVPGLLSQTPRWSNVCSAIIQHENSLPHLIPPVVSMTCLHSSPTADVLWLICTFISQHVSIFKACSWHQRPVTLISLFEAQPATVWMICSASRLVLPPLDFPEACCKNRV